MLLHKAVRGSKIRIGTMRMYQNIDRNVFDFWAQFLCIVDIFCLILPGRPAFYTIQMQYKFILFLDIAKGTSYHDCVNMGLMPNSDAFGGTNHNQSKPN